MFSKTYLKQRLGLLISALLLAVAASLGPLLLSEIAGISATPDVYACGSQSGGCSPASGG